MTNTREAAALAIPDAAVERHPGPWIGEDAELARACAMAVIPFYGTDEPEEHQRILKNGIWNDHIAVQAALAAIHNMKKRAAALPRLGWEAERLKDEVDELRKENVSLQFSAAKTGTEIDRLTAELEAAKAEKDKWLKRGSGSLYVEAVRELQERTAELEAARADLATFGRDTEATENRIIDAEFATQDLRIQLDAALAALKVKDEALDTIERWRDFPSTRDKWLDGSPVSYGAAFGSNGERDYMRQLARAARAMPEER